MPATYQVHTRSGVYQLPINGYILEADGAKLKDSKVRCSLAVYQGTAVLWRDDVNLGTSAGRAKARDEIAQHGVDVPDEALLALGEAIRNVLRTMPASNGKVIQFPTNAVNAQPTKTMTLDEVHEAFQRWLHMPDTGPLDVALATVVANHQSGDPIWLLIIDAPGGGKTEIINALACLPNVYSLATLTEASLLSGTSEQERSSTATGGLLRQVGEFGVLALKDFGSILSMQQDTRSTILAALREIYDGHWERGVGTDGGMTLRWEGKLGLVGGATPVIDRHHGVLALLGERFVFYRPTTDEFDREKRAVKALGDLFNEPTMRAELREAVAALFGGLNVKATPAPLTDEERDYLIKLASLAVLCRSAVERDPRTGEVTNIPDAEYPTRLVKVLAQLWYGLRLIGVEYTRAWELTRHVALSSMPKIRRTVLEHLAAQTVPVPTSDIATALNNPTNTMRRALEDLMCHGVVSRNKLARNNEYEWSLSAVGRQLWEVVAGFPEIREGGKHTDSGPEGGDGGMVDERVSPLSRISGKPLSAGSWCLLSNADGTLAHKDALCVLGVEEKNGERFARFNHPDMSGSVLYWPGERCEVLPEPPETGCNVCSSVSWRWDTVQAEWVCGVCRPQEEGR